MPSKKTPPPISATDINFDGKTRLYVDERTFQALGDQRYAFKLEPAGIVFEVDRLRRERHELTGELLVRVNGNFPQARTFEGVVSVGDFNFSSIQARSTRAKLLEQRAKNDDIDWYGLLEEFAVKVIKAERQGPSPIDLRTAPEHPQGASTGVWEVAGFPVVQQHPTVLYGSGGGGKSLLALYIAGSLAEQGVRVLYGDWEFSMQAHRRRYRQLFRPEPEGVFYLRCERPLRDEADKIRRVIKEHEIEYAIFDSVGYACDGRPEEAERANEYFRAIRSLGIGTLNLGHVTIEDDKLPKIFGSQFWANSARSTWYLHACTDNPRGELRFGLYQRKNSQGDLLAPRAYSLKFSDQLTTITEVNLNDIDELAAVLPLFDRIKRHLKAESRSFSAKELADALGTSQDAVRKTVARHRGAFVIVAGKVALRATEDYLPGTGGNDGEPRAEEF